MFSFVFASSSEVFFAFASGCCDGSDAEGRTLFTSKTAPRNLLPAFVHFLIRKAKTWRLYALMPEGVNSFTQNPPQSISPQSRVTSGIIRLPCQIRPSLSDQPPTKYDPRNLASEAGSGPQGPQREATATVWGLGTF